MLKEKLRLMFCTLILLSAATSAAAQDNLPTMEQKAEMSDETVDQDEFDIPVAAETNPDFYDEDEQLGQISDITPPECSSPQLFAKVRERIFQYMDGLTAKSTLAKREKALILANLGNFSEVSVEDFIPKTDYDTANALIMIKINEKIPEKDILLCKQNKSAGEPLYLVIYPYADNYQGYIINLDKNSMDYKDISFIYP